MFNPYEGVAGEVAKSGEAALMKGLGTGGYSDIFDPSVDRTQVSTAYTDPYTGPYSEFDRLIRV